MIERQNFSYPSDYLKINDMMERRANAIAAGLASEALWFAEFSPLYTAGTGATPGDLLDARFPVHKVGRGGKLTYHGPGQRVCYVMLNLNARNARDVRAYVNDLEEWLILTLKDFGIHGERRSDRVGIWVKDKAGSEAKIAAIGVRLRKWTTFHGIALNVRPDLSHFSGIVPCGISEYGVTSCQKLGVDISLQEADIALRERFEEIFG